MNATRVFGPTRRNSLVRRRDRRARGYGDLSVAAWPAWKTRDRNPYQALLYDAINEMPDVMVEEFAVRALLRRRPPNILHVHWPDAFLEAGSKMTFVPRYLVLVLIVALAKVRRVALVWTAHNLKRPGKLDRGLALAFWPAWFRVVDGVIFMTEASKAVACASLRPRVRTIVIAHGHYKSVIDNEPSDIATGRQILFFGGISAYKNVTSLLEAFAGLEAGTATLSIWGRSSSVLPDSAFATRLDALPSNVRKNIEFRDAFIPLSELVAKLRQVDVTVLPYSEVSNSGSALLALSASCPLLAPARGPFLELQRAIGAQWVMTFDGKLEPKHLVDAVARARALRLSSRLPNLDAYDWGLLAERTTTFYSDVLAAR